MKYLVDTSIWINHFRAQDDFLRQLLAIDSVVVHPDVILELAVGNIPNRQQTLKDLRRLPQAPMIRFEELLSFVEVHHLSGSGLSSVDVGLLGSALAAELELLTADKTLRRAWKKLTGII